MRTTSVENNSATKIARSWRRRPVAKLLAGTSMLLLPLEAHEVLLGFIVCIRRAGFRPFDAYDTEIGMEFASRAAIYLDNARRYSRERATALTLQRSMLPTGLSAPCSVEVKHRYLPGSQLIEVGGDWYESISLPGPGWRWWSATWPGTGSGRPSPWAGCARRSRRWRCWSCLPPNRFSSSTI